MPSVSGLQDGDLGRTDCELSEGSGVKDWLKVTPLAGVTSPGMPTPLPNIVSQRSNSWAVACTSSHALASQYFAAIHSLSVAKQD